MRCHVGGAGFCEADNYGRTPGWPVKEMRTALDCLPCFLRQTLHAARLCTADPRGQKEIVAKVLPLLATMDLALTPPENAIRLYHLIAELAGNADPFAAVKEASNSFAIRLRPRLQELLARAAEPFSCAVRLAIAGNVIDYGAQQDFNVEKAIENCLAQNPWPEDFAQFHQDVIRAETILYLGDNCGELVFDGLFIELLAEMGKRVILAVKTKPIINDALLEDARICGLDRYCEIIANGTGCPGTPLENCSQAFRDIFHCADLIISKGQGNFETLSETPGPMYYLLTVKCPVVAGHLSAQTGPGPYGERPAVGSMILMKKR